MTRRRLLALCAAMPLAFRPGLVSLWTAPWPVGEIQINYGAAGGIPVAGVVVRRKSINGRMS